MADNPAVLLALPVALEAAAGDGGIAGGDEGPGQSSEFLRRSDKQRIFLLSRLGSIRSSLAYCGKLTANGWSLLYFPEGIRSDDGTIGSFRPGIGLLASGLGVPVVPVYLKGTDSVVAKGGSRPHRGYIEVRFGKPLRFCIGSGPRRGNPANQDCRSFVGGGKCTLIPDLRHLVWWRPMIRG